MVKNARFPLFAVILASLLVSSCASYLQNSTKAVLFKAPEKPQTGLQRYQMQTDKQGYFFGSNPVFISSDSKFSIRINAVHPSWIAPPNRPLGAEGVSSISQDDGLSQSIFEHIRGKELRLLTTVEALDTSDPLETNSKRYFKATNVKFDAQSYMLVPLDSSERYVFTHESDTSYRVKFQLFEVDNLGLKKALVRVSRNPGIAGVLEDIFKTATNTLGALAGDIVTEEFQRVRTEELALERLLMQSGASEEFHGTILVLRDDDFVTKYGNMSVKTEFSTTKEALKKSFGDDAPKDIEEIIKASPSDVAHYIPDVIPLGYVENQYLLVDAFKCNESSANAAFDRTNFETAFNQISDKEFLFDQRGTNLVVASEEVVQGQKKLQTDCAFLQANSFLQFSVAETLSPRIEQTTNTNGSNADGVRRITRNIRKLVEFLDERTSDDQKKIAEIKVELQGRKQRIESENERLQESTERARNIEFELSRLRIVLEERKLREQGEEAAPEDAAENSGSENSGVVGSGLVQVYEYLSNEEISSRILFFEQELARATEFITNGQTIVSELKSQVMFLTQQQAAIERNIEDAGSLQDFGSIAERLNLVALEKWKTHLERTPD
jgi:hypothetical protein